MIRTTLFWAHLVIGLVAGLVVAILCVTGALLAFEKQITDWAERDARALPPPGATVWLSPEVLIAKAASVDASKPAAMAWSADAMIPVRVRLQDGSLVMLNGYTGDVLGRGAPSWRRFFRTTTELHTNLLMKLKGSWIVDVANVCFVVIIVSGLYLWWPRHWRWKALRSSVAIRLRARGKARDWNWHNAIGFWSLAPLLFIAASGLVLSFAPADKWWRIFASSHLLAAPVPPTLSVGATSPGFSPTSAPTTLPPSWNDLMSTVQRQFPGWHTIMSGNPSGLARQNTVTLAVNLGPPGERTRAYAVRLDKASNTIVQVTGWTNEDSGNRARAIARVGHTGEILGLWGQAAAFLGCLAGSVLVYTGFALSWRRFFPRRARASASSSLPAPQLVAPL